MAALDSMIDFLKMEVSERRFIHSLNTMKTAMDLAKRLRADIKKCQTAGLLHDCAKNIIGSRAIDMCSRYDIELDYVLRNQTSLLHGYLGRIVAREKFGIEDEEVLNAIANHTMGRPAMSTVEKIVFLADYIEPHRFYPGVEELRELAYKDPDCAVVVAVDTTIKKILSKRELLHTRIIETRNYYISIKGDMDGI
jgi:predicted HD superfamily hydrolase involved in NAD metabolism